MFLSGDTRNAKQHTRMRLDGCRLATPGVRNSILRCDGKRPSGDATGAKQHTTVRCEGVRLATSQLRNSILRCDFPGRGGLARHHVLATWYWRGSARGWVRHPLARAPDVWTSAKSDVLSDVILIEKRRFRTSARTDVLPDVILIQKRRFRTSSRTDGIP